MIEPPKPDFSNDRLGKAMGFDPEAMVKPKSKQDFLALLEEAHRVCDELAESFNTVFEKLKDDQNKQE